MLNNAKIDQLLGYYAAGQTKRVSDIIDMDGYDGVMFVASLGTVLETGTVDVYVEQNTANSTSGMARLATTTAYTMTAGDATVAKSAILVDVYKPQERYLQCNVTPAVANAVILGVVAIRYKSHLCPVTNGDVLQSTRLVSPAEA
jgi:hypothetical protein